MLRAALLALLVLAPVVALAPEGAAQTRCLPLEQVCWEDERRGACNSTGYGWTDVKARNVMAGFPLGAELHGHYVCPVPNYGTHDAWANLTVGNTLGVHARWQSHDGGWRWVHLMTNGTLVQSSTHWYGSTTCTLESYGTIQALHVAERRTCPREALPPGHPGGPPWGALLP